MAKISVEGRAKQCKRVVLRWWYTILPVLWAQHRLCSGGHFIETVS